MFLLQFCSFNQRNQEFNALPSGFADRLSDSCQGRQEILRHGGIIEANNRYVTANFKALFVRPVHCTNCLSIIHRHQGGWALWQG